MPKSNKIAVFGQRLRETETTDEATVGDILRMQDINPEQYNIQVGGETVGLDYTPANGEAITLVPNLSGGHRL